MLSSEESESVQVTLNPEWSITCRTCLHSGETRSLFEQVHETPFSYADKVMLCTNIIIREQDNLPDRICVDCIEELDVAYRFRMNCDSSNAILQSYLEKEKLAESEQVAQEAETRDVEITEEIAIPLDSGVLYTYKPPSGLNVKLIQRQAEGGHESPLPSTRWREDVSTDGENVSFEAIDTEGNNDDVIGIQIEAESRAWDDQSAKNSSINVDIKREPLEKLDRTAHVFQSLGNYDRGIIAIDADNITNSTTETVDGDNSSDSTIMGVTAENLLPSVPTNFRTLQTIRKTNTPNEVKPTIETVTTQPAADGSGIETLIRVKRNISATKRTHICEICNTTYKYKHALDTHLRRHRGDRPHKCEHCEKAFVVPFELRRHIRTHTGHKPYTCRYCERSYSDFGSKTKHERTHTGERPYRCDYCWKTFSYSHVLNSHLLIHTGVKKYSCATCGKRFTKSHHLKGHLKTHLSVSSKTKDGKAADKKQCTNEMEFTDMLTDGESVELKERSPSQRSNQVLVGSYVNTSHLATTGWTLADVSLPLSDTATDNEGTDGEPSMVGGSIVTIGAEDLGSVSIVSFNDYMIKTESIEGMMMDAGRGTCTGNSAAVQPHGVVDALQDFVTVLLPKTDSNSALVEGGFVNMEIIDG